MATNIEFFPAVLQVGTSVTAGTAFNFKNNDAALRDSATFQATMGTAGTTTATVDIEVSNDEVQWIVMGTITLNGVSDTDGYASSASWAFVRANVKALGTPGTTEVTVTMGV